MNNSSTRIRILVLAILCVCAPLQLFAQEKSLDQLFNDIPQSGSATGGQASSGGQPSSAGGAVNESKSSSAATAAAAAGSGTSWSLSGEQISVYHLPVFRDPIDYSGMLLKPKVENSFELTGRVGIAKLVSNWRVDLWPLGVPLAGATPLLSAGSADITLTPEDNYIEVGNQTLLFRAGYFVDTWGVADGINPTNNVNPVDYTQGLTPQSLPSLLFRAVYFPIPSLSIEAVFEPYKRSDSLPVDPVSSIPSSLFPSSEIGISKLPLELSSAVYGFKATVYSSVADFSLSYLYDVDPYYTPKVTYVSYLDKSLELTRGRIHRIGADAKTSLGPFGLWLESCLSITQDPKMTSAAVRNPFISWTAGSDVNYGPRGTFYANLQYTGRYVFNYYKSFYTDYPGGAPDAMKMATDPAYATTYYDRALSQMLGDQTEGLLSGFILKSDFPFADGKWKPGVTAAYYLPMIYDSTQATRYGSLLLQPKIDFIPTDSATISLAAELMYAWKKEAGSSSIVIDTADRVGMWNNQSNVSLSVDLKW